MKQNPFSFYDFLGYLIPGAVLLYVATFIFKIDVLVETFKLNENNGSTANNIMSFIPAVICCYLLGHILAIGSSAIIESYSKYSNGYPSFFLFNQKTTGYFDSETPVGNYGRLLLWVIILPISLLKLIMKDIFNIKMFNQAKPLPEPLKEAVFNKCKIILNEKIEVDVTKLNISEGIDGDYLRLLYHFVFEHSERHSNKLQNYVALYGLTRNVAFVFMLSFWLAVYHWIAIDDIKFNVIVCFSVLSYIFYIGFLKFYRRFTLEAIMGASVYCEKSS